MLCLILLFTPMIICLYSTRLYLRETGAFVLQNGNDIHLHHSADQNNRSLTLMV